MKRIDKILVANRGEISLRVMRTCRSMGIATVAVFSDADSDAPFVAAADEAVRLGPAPAAESYLAIERVIDAARRTRADAVHPGYGFLAENAAFARACADAGLVFIGPEPEVIRALGSKREAKRMVAAAGVPVIPGYDGDDQTTATLAAKAAEVGFPVLLKASAGGGGKGMRVVRDASGLDDAIESAKREAKSAFGDDTMLIEKYVEEPRHVEIQILGDQHGAIVHLFERECSIQRRHQKIVEETPSTALDPALRAAMGAAAVEVGRAAGYTNAGTVEFILGPDRAFYFLEVNTRLQVEHPVTECITGLDLVREQIRVARGEPLSLSQDDLVMSGAAIEVRLYAEDPDNGFLPASGRIVDWAAPDIEGLRIDTGVTGACDVGIHYDPMLAKIIAHGATRADAIRKLVYGLRRLSVQGIVTNRAFLVRVLEHPEHLAGAIDTHFLERHAGDLRAPPVSAELARDAAIAAALSDAERRGRSRTILPHIAPGYRNVRNQDEWVDYGLGDDVVRIHYCARSGGRYAVRCGDDTVDARVLSVDGYDVALEIDGVRRRARVVDAGDRRYVHGPAGDVTLVELPRFPDASAGGIEGGCVAPMPGAVVKVLVAAGDAVKAGQTLVILEAMKMEHAVQAPEAGTIESMPVAEGDQVDAGQLLAVVAPA